MRQTIIVGLLAFTLAGGCRSTRPTVNDNAIERDVRSRVTSDVKGNTYAVEVSSNAGVVTLSGTARSEEDRRAIGDAAMHVKGVATVINNIRVQQ